jgi:nitrous oxide reductase
MEITFKSTGKKFKTISDQISFDESDGLVYSGYDNVEFAENEDGSYDKEKLFNAQKLSTRLCRCRLKIAKTGKDASG